MILAVVHHSKSEGQRNLVSLDPNTAVLVSSLTFLVMEAVAVSIGPTNESEMALRVF